MELEEWKEHVSKLMPAWRNGDREEALKFAIAKVFHELQISNQALFEETFLGNAVGPRLDMQGYERGVDRFPNESDDLYRGRIKSFTGVTVNAIMAAISAAIDAAIGNSSVTYELTEPYDFSFADDVFADEFYPANVRPINTFLLILNGTASAAQKEHLYSILKQSIDEVKAYGVHVYVISYL